MCFLLESPKPRLTCVRRGFSLKLNRNLTASDSPAGLQVQKSRDLHLDQGSVGASGAKKQQNALGPARPWRRFAETLQTGAIVRYQRLIPGASLQHFSRPAPRTLQTSTKNPTDRSQESYRPAPKNPTDLRQRSNRQSPTTNVTITNHFWSAFQASFTAVPEAVTMSIPPPSPKTS